MKIKSACEKMALGKRFIVLCISHIQRLICQNYT